MERRHFLRALLATAGAALGPACREPDTYVPVEPGPEYFPQSVASGDPRSESVILWTRVADADADGDLELLLEVATDDAFVDLLTIDGGMGLSVVAEADFDGCVKVKLRGLEPATTYFYRFVYARDGRRLASPTGQTRTAPAADADVPVRFAFVSCQDYIGRYYNAYRRLATQELDFFVHLGDYIYETTGDPGFQSGGEARGIAFDDAAGAIDFGEGDYQAARSLDNYRQLYRTIRSDPALQAVHERMAMLAIWDDHEFSNDCYGASGTYFNDEVDETDEDRRKAANQAWFEYMPVDYMEEDFRYDASATFPGDIRIYRDFTFGQHLHLVLTDLRTYRADHVVPEGAFPGTVVVEEAALMAQLGALPGWAAPYIDVDTYAGGIYGDVLRAAAPAIGYDPAAITGKLDADFINRLLAEINPTLPMAEQVPEISEADKMGLRRGVAIATTGKLGLHSSFGSRYLVVQEAFDAFARARFEASGGDSERTMGPEQEAWFLDTMQGSDRTWKVWGNEFTLSPLRIDLSTLPLPPPFSNRFFIVGDSWDGMPGRRDVMIEGLADVDNVVVITGDIHAFFAGTPMSRNDPGAKVIELVTSSITSTTFQRELEHTAASEPSLADVPGVDQLASSIRDFLVLSDTNPHLAHADVTSNGFVAVELDGATFTATYHSIPDSEVTTDYAGMEAALDGLFSTTRFRVNAGERELYQEQGGAWKRWDTATRTWV
ncbi:MAG: alkaline phosphatase D family protein [Myxococcales bacterium]|nr:alkaline phosphatase D family protein [Myxococcales bacterium]